jgi:hypothetical protein
MDVVIVFYITNCYRYVTTCYFRQSAKHQHFCTSILQKNKPALLTAIDADRSQGGAQGPSKRGGREYPTSVR